MSSSYIKVSSGSDMDKNEKKRKRMISNRESARRSRMKRQKHLEDLIREKAALEIKLHENDQKFVALWKSLSAIESENNVLRAESMRLEEYLESLNQILVNYKETRVGVPSETFLNPWQVHNPVQTITASGLFKF